MSEIAALLMRRAAALMTVLLLGLAVASPAIAEVGCSWDAARHLSDVAGHIGEHGGENADPGSDDGGSSSEADRDSHCAFGHGHGSLSSGAAGPVAPPRVRSFAPATPARFVSSLPSGFDRPPRA